MPLASSWMDLVVGLDVHLELVPASPAPVPFPHPFVGLVGDPVGFVVGEMIGAVVSLVLTGQMPPTGPVMIGNSMATVTGDDALMPVPHLVIPPGVSWPLPAKPSNDAMLLVGSQTVLITGQSAVRAGEVAFSCSEPVRLPTATVVSTSTSAPTMIGGPPGINMDTLCQAVAGRALRNKWTADKLHGAVNAIIPKKYRRIRKIAHKTVCFFTGHPVSVATGSVSTNAVDLELPGPIPLTLSRDYDSNWCDRDSPIGFGWSHSLDQKLWLEAGCVAVQLEDGREIEFDTEPLPDGVMRRGDEIFHPVHRLTLRALGQLRWELEAIDGIVREFGPVSGEHAADKDRGLTRLLRIRDRVGHEIRLQYDEYARLEGIVDCAGRVVRLEYGRDGRLRYLWVPTPDGQGHRQHAEYLYTDHGDLREVRDALGKPSRFDYDQHLLVQETDRNGLSFYFEYEGWGPYARCVRTWGDGEIYDHLIAYDVESRRTVVTNSLRENIVYEIDGLGMVTKITQPDGTALGYEYDEAMRLTAEIDPLGNATRYHYDERGNRTMIVGPDKAITKIRYGEMDLPQEVVTPTGASWRWRYDSSGRVVAEIDPLGHTTRYVFEGKRLTRIVDPEGGATELTWDARLDLVGLQRSNGAQHRWQHDALGRAVVSVDPRGNALRRSYDALGRPIRQDEPDGNVRIWEYDGEGNVIRAADRLRDARFEYTGVRRLASRTIGGATVRLEYDTEGQLVGVVNERGDVHRFELDPAGKVRAEIGFDGRSWIYERDAAGRVVRVLRPGVRRTTRYGYDAAGRLSEVQHSDGSAERYAYREDGALIRAVNDTCTVELERDALGRVVRERQGDDDWVQSHYDHRGSRIGVRSSRGARQTIERDAVGDVQRIVYANGPQHWEARFSRDIMGLEVDRWLPGDVRSHHQRDVVGRIARHWIGRGSQPHRDRSYTWDVGDRLLAIEDQGRDTVRYRYDARGRLESAEHGDGRLEVRAPDEVGNLFRSLDRRDRSYGRAGQLLRARTPEGERTYVYDDEGNLARRIDPDGGQWSYSWGGAGRLMQVDRPDGKAVVFEYDAFARRVSKSFDGVTTRWIWDGDNPLHEWTEAGPVPRRRLTAAERARWEFLEGARDELLTTFEDGAARLERLLDEDGEFGRLHAEFRREHDARGQPESTDASAAATEPVTWLFEPESFSPMARGQGSQVDSIVTDHLGTPLAVLDAGGESRWQATHDSFGNASAEGGAGLCPWRFPGQYEDAETGLFYNRFRYYDPIAGRYASADPLGLRGGLGLYAYVGAPMAATDPLGLVETKRGPGGCTGGDAEGEGRGDLDWTRTSRRTGGDAAHHVRRNHGDMRFNKPYQGVFYDDPIATTNDAWRIAGEKGITPITVGNRDIYVVPRHRSGYAGGMGGQRETFDHVTVITETGTNRVVTAFPSGRTPPLSRDYFTGGTQ